MSMAGLAGGAARRRRERQLRSFLRHEELSVKMALARALHHSAQPGGPVVEEPEEEVEFEEHAGLRAQNTPPPGSRPGVLKDPGPPWVEAVTVGYVAAGAPSLVVASVAAHDGLDDATVQFLLQQSLLAVAAEEEEAREREEVKVLQEKVKEKERRIVEEIDRLRGLGENDRSPLLTRTCAWYVARRDLLAKLEKKKRKRKKRSKKKLPKSSSTRFSRGVRGRRCGQGFRSRSSSSGARGCSLPSSSSTTAACSRLVLLVCAPRDVFPSVVVRPAMFASWPKWTRRTISRSSSPLAVACARLVLLVVCAVPFRGLQAQMLDIMAGMEQKDSYVGYEALDKRGVSIPLVQFLDKVLVVPVLCNDRYPGPDVQNCEVSTGAVPGQVIDARCATTGAHGPDSTENSGVAADAVHLRWLTSLRLAATSSCSRVENSRYAQCKLCIFRGDPPGAALEQGCRVRCVQRQALVFQTVQKTCGGPAGAQV